MLYIWFDSLYNSKANMLLQLVVWEWKLFHRTVLSFWGIPYDHM